MQKQLLITFDYELFLGNRSGTVNDCMIEPVESLIRVMQPYNIHAVFFVDTTYLVQLQKLSAQYPPCKNDFELIKKQLQSLVQLGHYVFPHIHPHWEDAVYLPATNQWQLNHIEKYRFHNVDETTRAGIFDNSVKILQDIIHPVQPAFKVNGYRAGGWCIQPFDDFKPHFDKHNFIYDFSVLSGFFHNSTAQFYDFSTAPRKSVYRFQDDVCEESVNGRFIEFSISSVKIPLILNMINKIWLKYQYRILNDHTFKKGEGQHTTSTGDTEPAAGTGKNMINTSWERISIELLTSVKLPVYTDYMKSSDYMHFISHPKMITRHNLKVFDKFLKMVFDKYTIETDFHKMIPE